MFYKVDLKKIVIKRFFSHNSEQDAYSSDIWILGIYFKFGTKNLN